MTWTTSAARGEAMAKRHWIAFQGKPVRYSLLAAMAVYLITLEHQSQSLSAAQLVDQAAVEVSLLAITPATFIMIAALLFALQQIVQPNALAIDRASPLLIPARQGKAGPHPLAASSLGTEAYEGLMSRLNHDLRTPLNAMLGFADLMNAETFGPLGDERYRAYAAHMQTCGRELLSATETTLAMAALLTRPQHSELGSQRLNDLVLAAWAVAMPLLAVRVFKWE